MRKRYLFVMGGGSRIAHAVGSAWALQMMGQEFDGIICVSMGVLVGVYMLQNRSLELLHLLSQSFARKSDLVLTSDGLLFDADEFIKRLALPKRIDNLYVMVTDRFECESQIIPFTPHAALASMTIPSVTTHSPTRICGEQLIDGSINMFPAEKIARLTGSAEILMLANRPISGSRLSALELSWAVRSLPHISPSVFAKVLRRSADFKKSVETARELDLDLNIIWPANDISPYEANLNGLYNAAMLAAERTFQLYGYRPLVLPDVFQGCRR